MSEPRTEAGLDVERLARAIAGDDGRLDYKDEWYGTPLDLAERFAERYALLSQASDDPEAGPDVAYWREQAYIARGSGLDAAAVLIPEGAVLMTEESLAAELSFGGYTWARDTAAAIFARINRGGLPGGSPTDTEVVESGPDRA